MAELALHHDDRLEIWHPADDIQKFGGLIITTKVLSDNEPAGLIKTCRQMRRDYQQLFFANNNFTVHVAPENVVTSLTALLRAIGRPNLKVIPSIAIEVSFSTIDQLDEDWGQESQRIDHKRTNQIFADVLERFKRNNGRIVSRFILCKSACMVAGFTLPDLEDESKRLQRFYFDFSRMGSSLRHA